jgi:hypothetical protein
MSIGVFGNSREEVALSGIVDVLTWRHPLETSQDPNYLRRGQRVIVYPVAGSGETDTRAARGRPSKT